MSNGNSKEEATFKVRLYKNQSSTAAEAPYLGRVVQDKVLDEAGFIAAIHKQAPQMSETTIKCVMDALFEEITDCLREGKAVKLSSFTVEPHITGSFDSEDAAFDPSRNQVVVKMTPSASLRKELAKAKAEIIDTPQSDLSLNGVETTALGRAGVNVVVPGSELTITGNAFTDGTLTATIVDASGVGRDIALAQIKSIYAQGTAPTGLVAGDAQLTLTLAVDNGLTFSASRKVTIVTA